MDKDKKKPGLMIGIMAGKPKKGEEEGYEDEGGGNEDYDAALDDAAESVMEALAENNKEAFIDSMKDMIQICSM